MNNPGRFELRNDGAFWSTQSPGASIRAVKAWGRTYVVQRSIGGTGTYYSTSPGAEDPTWRLAVICVAGAGRQRSGCWPMRVRSR